VYGPGLTCLGQAPVQFYNEHGDDPSGSKKGVQLHDQLSDYQRFKHVFPHGNMAVQYSVNVTCILSKSRSQ
jgi:hypothetical protein